VGVRVKREAFVAELGKFAKVGLDSSILIYHLEDSLTMIGCAS
jgi:hypothetical protein